MSDRKLAIILARVSSSGQAEEELPVASQLEVCRQKALELNADVTKEFIEDGVSGRKLKRAVFDQAVEYCELMTVDYFVVWDTSRFARNKALAAWTKLRLARAGTRMVYVSQDIDTSTDDGWLLEGLNELMDESRSRRISKDTLRSMMKNARDGNYNGGRVPFGYRVVSSGRRRRLEVDEAEASLVRAIFAESRAGAGAKSIATWLNGQGATMRGRRWAKNTVTYMLGNWVYAGYTTFNRRHSESGTLRSEDEWIRTKGHPPIIDEEDFVSTLKSVSRRGRERGHSGRSEWLFTGVIRCEACKCAMTIVTGTGRSRIYSYYRCNATVQGHGCGARPIPAEDLDQWLLAALRERILSRENLADLARQVHELSGEWVRERAADRGRLVGTLRDAEGRRKKLFDLLELHGRDAPNLADITVRVRELNATIRATEEGLAKLEAAPPPPFAATDVQLEALRSFAEDMIERGSRKKVREFLQTFVERVVVAGREAVIYYHPGRLVSASPVEVVRSTGKWLPDSVRLRTAAIAVGLPERYWRAAA